MRKVIPDEVLLAQRWYVVVDDCIGGYAIANVDKYTSALDFEVGDRYIGDALTEGIARHIVELHNSTL